MNNAQSFVSERRLRPIYELLDSGNNKKVITEADKLMKKQPDFPCAKLLKALALIRLNKPEDARVILDDVVQDAPVDDSSIQALSICYRELDDPVSLCTVLEAASKKQATEELLTHCFMAQVRISDFQKQHLTALTLYKSSNKPTYFGWAIASLLMKYESNPGNTPGGPESLPLQLAERMCDKFLVDQSIYKMEEYTLYLYLEILKKLNKWEKILKLIEENLYPYKIWDNSHTHGIYCQTMMNLGKHDELFVYLKSKFMKNTDDYAILKEIITLFGNSKKQEVLEFLNELRANQPSRVVGLCDLHFYYEYLKDDLQFPRVEEDFQMVMKFGATKLSFYSEMIDYYRLLKEDCLQKMLELLNLSKCDNDGNYVEYGKIIKDVNYEMLLRDVKSTNDEFQRIKRANRCFGKFLVCEEAVKTIRRLYTSEDEKDNLRAKESDFHDLFLILAASSLVTEYFNPMKGTTRCMAEFVKKLSEWTQTHGYPKEVKEKQEIMEKEYHRKHAEDVNVQYRLERLNLENKINHLEQDQLYLLIMAVMMLEYGIKCSPYNYAMRILLCKIYNRLGATESAYAILQTLDLKHVQWDSLGYLIIFETLTHGSYQDAERMLASADNMYSTYRRESMEHVITAYKFGSFNKVGEFLDFRKQLLNSTYCGLVFCEKRLHEYVTSTHNFTELKKAADTVGKELRQELLRKSEFTDNRDFSVLQNLDEIMDMDLVKEKSAECEEYFYKLRIPLLFILTKLVAHTENLESQNQRKDLISSIKLFNERIKEWDTVKSTLEAEIPKTPLLFSFPSLCHKYIELGCGIALQNVMGYVGSLLCSEDFHDYSNKDFTHIIEEGLKQILTKLSAKLNPDKESAFSEITISAVFFGFHYAVETLSFLRIVLECAVRIDKHKLNLVKNDTKKKGRTSEAVNHRKKHAVWVKCLNDQVETIISLINKFQSKLSSMEYHKWDEYKEFYESQLQPATFAHLYPACYHLVACRLESSHRNQADEIKKVAQGLLDYFKNIDLTL